MLFTATTINPDGIVNGTSDIATQVKEYVDIAIQWLTDKTGTLTSGTVFKQGGEMLSRLGVQNSFMNTPLFWILLVIFGIILIRVTWRFIRHGLRYVVFMILGGIITFFFLNFI